MMRRVLAAIILTLAASAASLGQTNPEAAREASNEGARLYREGQYAEAEQHFRRALELDPEGKNARLFIARAVQQQFKPGDTSPGNVALAEKAIAAYGELLGDERHREDAYRATVFLYGQLKRDDKVIEMLTQRAEDPSVPNEKRAEAFVILASRQWQCSYDITERRENKWVEQRPDRPLIRYRMPADRHDFVMARRCAHDGLRLSDHALTLDSENVNAWAYKSNLFREEAKLAEMEGDAAQKEEYERRYEEALANHQRLSAEAARKREAEERGGDTAPRPPTPPGLAPTGAKKTIATGGVLNHKAISKPMPAYPPEAKAAGARGTVVVRIVIDESGKVVKAEAVSGDLLLRPAAEAAAREARFAPTRLSGRPVQVAGVITYNFVPR